VESEVDCGRGVWRAAGVWKEIRMAAERDDQRQDLGPGRPAREGEELKNLTERQEEELKGAAVTAGVGAGCLGMILSPFVFGIGILVVALILGLIYMIIKHH
jgi:hypothetical protein